MALDLGLPAVTARAGRVAWHADVPVHEDGLDDGLVADHAATGAAMADATRSDHPEALDQAGCGASAVARALGVPVHALHAVLGHDGAARDPLWGGEVRTRGRR